MSEAIPPASPPASPYKKENVYPLVSPSVMLNVFTN